MKIKINLINKLNNNKQKWKMKMIINLQTNHAILNKVKQKKIKKYFVLIVMMMKKVIFI